MKSKKLKITTDHLNQSEMENIRGGDRRIHKYVDPDGTKTKIKQRDL